MASRGFLGSFLSKGLKTNQLEVNTDEKTLRPIARLKEPRELFALPKDKDNDCPQQAPRWPIECQVLDERVIHIPYTPDKPEPYNTPTGQELKPRPVGEENGVVVFNYNPISAVNYDNGTKLVKKTRDDSSDSDISSSASQSPSPSRLKKDDKSASLKHNISNFVDKIKRSTSNSNDDDDDDDDEDDDDEDDAVTSIDLKNSDIDDIWAGKSPEYPAASPTFIKNQFGKDVPKSKMEVGLYGIPPVILDSVQMARLEISSDLTTSSVLSRTSSSSSVSTEGEIATERCNRKTRTKIPKIKTDETKTNSQTPSKLPLKTPSKANTQKQNKPSNRSQALQTNLKPKVLRVSSKITKKPSINQPLPLPTPPPDVDKSLDSITDSSLPQFSRSAVGGSKFITNCHPCTEEDYDGLEFESRFESGNLAKAVKITPTYYELYLRPDLYTSRSKQWFYFRVRRTRRNLIYRFSIVNLVKADSLYNEGMRPLMYSTMNCKDKNEGWRRCGDNICYYRNDDESSSDNDDEDNSSYTLTFNMEFQNDNDTVYFAHSYPYTYSDLQDYLMDIQKHPVKSKFCKLRLLCRSLAGNNVYYLTVTAPTNDEEAAKRKKSIVVSARVHPSETPASWMMKGLMDFITGDTLVAKRLRHKFIFKLIPMLNPDGVIVGNTRNSLTGKDLNRQYRTVIRETYPSIWYTKAMIKRLIDECGVSMYCDMHAHSRKHNIFIYGCENKRNPEKKLTEQVFPLMMHKNVADKFSFEGCKFKIQRSKEGTGRIVVWLLGITNSYTIEASFGGSSLGSRKGTHFTTTDYEHIGRSFCETLLDYCDENPNKVKKQAKMFRIIKKIRKRERREKEALKWKKLAEQERLRLKIIERLLKEGSSAEEPLNIPLSDYSSDEGDTSSSSENEGKYSIHFSDLEGPCCRPTKAPPTSPENQHEIRKFKFMRMRKIMLELDRIYFQPLLRKKFNIIMKAKTAKVKKVKKNALSQREKEKAKETDKDKNEENKETDKDETTVPEELSISAEEDNIRNPIKRRFRRRRRKGKPPVEGANPAVPVGPKKLRVPRTLRIWLAKRAINIFRQRKEPRFRLKTRGRSTQRRKAEANRIRLDMPTTDPGSDIHFSTDDELCGGDCGPHHHAFSTMPRTRRSLMQSELQRRYFEEIAEGAARPMPPELIVTSPNKQNITKGSPLTYKQLPKTAPDKDFKHSDFAMFGQEKARRTSSWHNLNNASNRNLPRMRMGNPYKMGMPLEKKNKEELQTMLSLRKKIWTGVQPESATQQDRNRPLSWGLPPLVLHPKRELSNAPLQSNQRPVRSEQQELVSACSEKLMAWQQTLNTTKTSRQRLNMNLIAPEIAERSNESKTRNRNRLSVRLPANDNKAKRKPNSLTKIAETTQIITHFAKTKPRAATTTGTHQRLAPHKVISTRNLINHSTNKFKTGGIVATAVQPNSKKVKKPRITTAGPRTMKIQPAESAGLRVNASTTPNTPLHIAVAKPETDANNYMRRIKATLRRKKSSAHIAIGVANGTAMATRSDDKNKKD